MKAIISGLKMLAVAVILTAAFVGVVVLPLGVYELFRWHTAAGSVAAMAALLGIAWLLGSYDG